MAAAACSRVRADEALRARQKELQQYHPCGVAAWDAVDGSEDGDACALRTVREELLHCERERPSDLRAKRSKQAAAAASSNRGVSSASGPRPLTLSDLTHRLYYTRVDTPWSPQGTQANTLSPNALQPPPHRGCPPITSPRLAATDQLLG
ncbi:hypothetical protein DIPPA_10114 [Diplonema papillatum]|nr:hypothetical protein DIPPA_10114 [Diplonema papillatum]